MNLAELRAALAAKKAEARTLAAKTDWTAEDATASNALLAEISAIEAKIQLTERSQEQVANAAGGQTVAQAQAAQDAATAAQRSALQTAAVLDNQPPNPALIPDPEARTGNGASPKIETRAKDPTKIYRDICEQLNDIKDAGDIQLPWSKREKAINKLNTIREQRVAAGNTLTDDEGGWAVQGDISQEIQRLVYMKSPLASAARPLPLSTGSTSITLPYLRDKDRTTSGVEAYWANEGATVTKSGTAKVDKLTISLKKLIAIWDATDELMNNAGIVQSLTLDLISDRMAFKLEDAILRGDGTVNPKGILNSDALITIAKETGQAADSFVFENLVKMYAASYGRTTVFFNRELMTVLPFLKLDVGLGGSALYMPQGGAADGPITGRLYGMPMSESEHLAALGDLGDILLFDMSQYGLLRQGATRFDTSIHVRFNYDETTFRFIDSVGGAPLWNEVLTPYKGARTRSPFVALAARA